MSLIPAKLSIIVPAFNEATTIDQVLTRLAKLQLIQNIEKEIVVVNDHSSDATKDKINTFIQKNPEINLIAFHQPYNQGKGAAIHKGIELASGSILVIQDADLELVPEELNLLLDVYLEKENRIVYGSRFLENKHEKTNFLWHIVGNGVLTRLSNLFSGVKLTDMMTCYKMMPTSVIQHLDLKEKRFGFEPEVTVKLAKLKTFDFVEVPITYVARDKQAGKKISWKDGIKVIYCILRYRLFP
jgi:glycosyltransferase involved in cell wall biosynthesis